MTIQNPKRSSFRTDINGLRAWAVVAVVLYHFGVPGFRGGFVGVDVFFVISGFLMTGLIISGLEKRGGRSGFSLWGFYLARARRIVPALAVLCATLLAAGWFFIPVFDYRQLGQHVVAALAFVSNLKFRSESGYFDVDSHEKWLLHTWSLSVEWQFYLFLPLILLGLWRLFPNRRIIGLWLMFSFLASLIYSIALTPLDPGGAFYLLPTRAWEMLAGGLIFLMPEPRALSDAMRRGLEALGFALILGAIAFIDPGASWPGWLAMIPVAGAMLVLGTARVDSPWTGTRIAQWLGNCSYSIYLWHWPVTVLLLNFEWQKNPLAIGAGLLASLALGYASYAWVEQPSRKRLTALSWRRNLTSLGALMAAIAVPGVLIYLGNGLQGRLSPRVDAIFSEVFNTNPRMKECHKGAPGVVPECTYGGPALGAIMMGDSHAASVVRTLEKAMDNPGKHVLDWTYTGCPTLIGARNENSGQCGEFIDFALNKQKTLGQAPLVIVNRTSLYSNGHNEMNMTAKPGKPEIYFNARPETADPAFLNEFRARLIETTCKFAETRAVYLVRPIPEMRRHVPRTMGRAVLKGNETRVSISLDEYHERHRFVWAAQDAARTKCGVRILDPLPYLCRDGRCWGDKDGLPLYYDDNHLSERGALLLLPMFRSIFK